MSKSKLTSLDDAVAVVQDGSTLGLGGWIFYGQPMALVRAVIRKGAKISCFIKSGKVRRETV